jgi:hypothetical protein
VAALEEQASVLEEAAADTGQSSGLRLGNCLFPGSSRRAPGPEVAEPGGDHGPGGWGEVAAVQVRRDHELQGICPLGEVLELRLDAQENAGPEAMPAVDHLAVEQDDRVPLAVLPDARDERLELSLRHVREELPELVAFELVRVDGWPG